MNKKKKQKFKSPGVFTIERNDNVQYLNGTVENIIALIKQFPNDQELGREIRRYYFYETKEKYV